MRYYRGVSSENIAWRPLGTGRPTAIRDCKAGPHVDHSPAAAATSCGASIPTVPAMRLHSRQPVGARAPGPSNENGECPIPIPPTWPRPRPVQVRVQGRAYQRLRFMAGPLGMEVSNSCVTNGPSAIAKAINANVLAIKLGLIQLIF